MRRLTITDIIDQLLDDFSDRLTPKRIIAAVKDAQHGDPGGHRPQQVERRARQHLNSIAGPPPCPVTTGDPVARAHAAGITAVWTGDCSATVELARLAGPSDETLTVCAAVIRGRLPGTGPWQLATPAVRTAIYEYCLTSGSPHEIYRWVNLADLAAIWTLLHLPTGVHHEWRRALSLCGLLEPAGE